MLPTLGEERARPIRRSCRSRRRPAGAAGAGRRARCQAGTIVYRGRRQRRTRSPRRSPAGAASCNGGRTGRCAGWRSASTTRCPARIWSTRSSCPSEICRALGGPAAGRLQLRALHGRERPEDLQVEGQRPDHGGVAALRRPESLSLYMYRAEGGQAALFRRHPAPRRRVCAVPRGLRPPGPARAARTTRSGTSMPARRPRPTIR